MERQCLWVRRLYIEKIFPELIYRFNRIPVKILKDFSFRNGKAYLKSHVELQKNQSSQNNLQNKNKVGGIRLSSFKTYCQTAVIKTVVGGIR